MIELPVPIVNKNENVPVKRRLDLDRVKKNRRRREQAGVFVLMATVMLTILFGFLALATDMGWLYRQRRSMQSAADAGAIYGAQQIRRGANTQADVESLSDHGALKGTSDNGFTNGVDGAVVTVSYPPVSGNYAGNNLAVEVMVCQQQRTFFMPVLGVYSADVCARAVAGYLGQGEGCIYALNPTEEKTMYVHSNTTAIVSCGVIVNSDNPGALDVTTDGCLTSGSISVAGTDTQTPDDNNYCGYGYSASIDVTPFYNTPPEPDPLAYLGIPPEVNDGCYKNDFVLDAPAKLGELLPNKKWCRGLKIDCDTCGTITLPAGNYVIAGKRLEIVGNTVVEGSGVMFYATDFPAESVNAEGIFVGSNPTVTLSAPTSGDFEGILMYVDRYLSAADHYLNIEFMSDSIIDLHGALYTLNGTVKFHSGVAGSNTAADGLAIVADKVEISSIGFSSGNLMNVTEDFSDLATGSPIKRVTLLE